MDRALYTAAGAANAALNRQAVTANNLANTSTPGFRAQLAAFRAVPVIGPTDATRVLVAESTPFHDGSLGPVNHTGRSLDVALPQNGWLAVEMPDGREGYTRNGGIQRGSDGALSVSGYPLLGDNGPLSVPPLSTLTIGPDGTLTVRGAGDDAKSLVTVGRLKLVEAAADQLQHGDEGMFHALTAEPLPAAPALRLSPEALEGSNVSPVSAMTAMIAAARGFDLNMKTIHSADENARQANQLLSAV